MKLFFPSDCLFCTIVLKLWQEEIKFLKWFRILTFYEQVVPFTPSAGVLEWVNGTLPLGGYLIGRSVKERQVLLHNFLIFLSLKQLIHVVNQLSQKLLREST